MTTNQMEEPSHREQAEHIRGKLAEQLQTLRFLEYELRQRPAQDVDGVETVRSFVHSWHRGGVEHDAQVVLSRDLVRSLADAQQRAEAGPRRAREELESDQGIPCPRAYSVLIEQTLS